MEAAVAFQEKRIEERVRAVESGAFLAVEPFVELLERISSDREAIIRWGIPPAAVDTFRDELLSTCEEAKDAIRWRPTTVAARMCDVSAETIRDWIRQNKVKYRGDAKSGYRVYVPDALRQAGMMNR